MSNQLNIVTCGYFCNFNFLFWEPCDAEIDCSANGQTTDTDKTDGCICVCDNGWTGDDCSEEVGNILILFFVSRNVSVFVSNHSWFKRRFNYTKLSKNWNVIFSKSIQNQM